MKRKLSLIASIVNTVGILAFGVVYGLVFWILASLFFDLGAKGELVPTLVLFCTMALVLVCFVINIIMIKVSVVSIEKYARSKVFVIITVIFNVLLAGFVVYSMITVEELFAIILLGVFVVILLSTSALYIVDLVKEKSRLSQTAPTQAVQQPTQTADNK